MHPALLLALGCACAHSAVDREQSFRGIQRYEAEIARGEAALRAAEPASLPELEARALRHHEAESVCSASQALCVLSGELDDRDATARCLRARDACSSARKRAEAEYALSPRDAP